MRYVLGKMPTPTYEKVPPPLPSTPTSLSRRSQPPSLQALCKWLSTHQKGNYDITQFAVKISWSSKCFFFFQILVLFFNSQSQDTSTLLALVLIVRRERP